MAEFIFYETDSSFCFGDFPNGCYCDTELHGFEMEDTDITTLKGFGDYSGIEREVKSLTDLKEYLISHIEEIEKESTRECVEELIEIITEEIQKENKDRKVA